jgi:hypothetical protein
MMKQLDRRTILKGLGGIVVGLPFMEEMYAATPKNTKVPVRAFNVFFGLGIPTPLQEEGFKVLEPLKPFSKKLLIMKHVDHVRAEQRGINGHFDGSAAAFTAVGPDGEAKSLGPSIDQVVRHSHYPKGLPKGMVPTLNAGTYFRRSRICRYIHSYNLDGTVSARMQEKPRDVFDRIFGSIDIAGDPDSKRQRYKRSVLDSVLEQYNYYQGPHSPLGSASKARLAEHLERIREYEQRAYKEKRTENGLILPPRSKVLHGGKADPGGSGIDMELVNLRREWRLMADIYALAIQMDRVRFGAITFLAAGERLRITGDYLYNKKKIFTFDDKTQLKKGGSGGCSHEWWHKFGEKKPNIEMRAHVHMKLQEVAYFLSLLDGKDAIDGNGKTILDNALISISTESGDGRHNDPKRELSGVFHAISTAGGRFKNGIVDVNAEGIDVYNTMLKAMGCKMKLGPKDRQLKHIDKILS